MENKSKNENTGQNEQNNETENIKFCSLAPVKSDNYDKYNDAFRFALNYNGKSKKITNIAVTGPYASGKSSVIENVRNKFGSEKFITLSLTNFNSGDMEDDKIIIKSHVEEDLEAQLINQLIHKIDSKNIKDSRFLANKKVDTSKLSYKVGTFIHALIISIIFLCLIIVNINDETISKILFLKLDDIKIISINILFIVGSIYSLYFGYKMINLFKKKKILRKINIYGNEIELFNNEDNSIFDKYTDEILYLFKNAKVDYFIFEDIDRYEDVTIFKKLREINILLNETLKRENKEYKSIKFIYLICDNMFTAEERTKFFDFIIPVVPYIHKGNAYDYMAELFADEINDERNKKFLIKISLFIDNSRIINNIVNEYYIYNKFIKLKDREPHTKFIKLLSLLIYKNTFPKDFEQLYINKGYLAELFNKEEFIKLVKLEDFTQNARDNEYSILGENNPADNIIIYKEHIKETKTIREILKIIYDKDLFFTAPKGYDYIYNSGYFNLIKFLIENRYIDETYKDYMSEISENNLTYAERAFLQNIYIKGEPLYKNELVRMFEKQYLYNLQAFLEEDDYEIISILNIDFFLALLKFNDEHKLKLIINVVKENKKYDFILQIYLYMIKSESIYKEFINNYFEQMKELIVREYEAIKYFFKDEKNGCNELFYLFMLDFIKIKKEMFINKKEDDFLFINNTNISIIENDISNNTCYTKVLDKINNLFIGMGNNYKKLNVANIIYALKDIGIKFLDIQNIKDKYILKDILDYYMFQPTYDNIVHILKTEYNIIAYPNIEKKPYNSLIETKQDDLKEYVDNNITYFLKSYPEEIKTLEDKKLIEILYNSDKITQEDREELKTRFNIK